MNDDFTDISLARPRRKSLSATRRAASVTVALPRNPQITDAAFADFATTTLRLDEPLSVAMRKDQSQPCDNLVQQLAGQLQALDQQRERLTGLLNDLQSPHSAAV